MRVKTAVLWWLVRDRVHPSLTDQEMTVTSLVPLVDALFPGIAYSSLHGFRKILEDYVRPALRKRYPELVHARAAQVPAGAITEVKAVMPSRKYEWQDSTWKAAFQRFLVSR